MAKKTTISTFLIISISILFANVYTKPSMVSAVVGLTANDDIHTDQLARRSELSKLASNLSCANPIPTMVATCQAIEQDILDLTVRIFNIYVPFGNNWSRSAKCDQEITSKSPHHTSVALNSQLVLAP